MSGVDIKAKGLVEADKNLADMIARVEDLEPAMKQGAEAIKKLIDDSFHQGRSPAGELFAPHAASTLAKWAPLQKRTLKTRRRQHKIARELGLDTSLLESASNRGRGRLRKILVDTATLRNSTYATGGKDSILFGTNVEYAGVHQFGSEDGKTPRRSFLPVEKTGAGFALVTRGPAAKVMETIRGYILKYVTKGKR